MKVITRWPLALIKKRLLQPELIQLVFPTTTGHHKTTLHTRIIYMHYNV